MLILPRCLGVIERRRISGELKLLHHRMRAALFPLEQNRHVNLEFDKLRRLIFIAARDSIIKRFKTLLRLCVVLFLKGYLRQVKLRFAEFRVEPDCLLKCSFGLVKLLLRHQNFAT